ncbi:MAG: UDP-glucose 6-dehydrogenase [Candidatus Binatia bacterium]|nr:MAG: UDP-glucose 6-dehydrogenase [Candidatus Binatia bacterium]
MKLCVVGTGYVGLVAGTCFAESGNDVVCVDIDAEKVGQLRRGTVPIYEPGLEELVRRNLEAGRLDFTTDLRDAVRRSLLCFLAVGTPEAEDGGADLSGIFGAAAQIAEAMDGYRVIVTKSTVPVGTSEKIRELVASRTRHEFDVASNPEFLKEGAAIEDFMKPDRVIIGCRGPRAIELLRELYAPFVRTEHPILVMSPESAEMTKYAANALLAARISLINEIANLCERTGAEVDDVRRGVGFDRRIGHHFLFPGVGYGGSCFPKDVRALIRTANQHGLPFRLLEAVEEVNERQKGILAEKVLSHFGGNVEGKRLAVWGLAFKPRTDDMRQAPSITIVGRLLEAGAELHVHDPEAMREARKIFGDRVVYHRVNYEALEGADALLLVTEWNQYRRPDFERMRRLMRQPVIFDGRNVYDPAEMREFGFVYYSIGRAPIFP